MSSSDGARITSTYLHQLQAIYHRIDNRGLKLHEKRLEEAKDFIEAEIQRNCAIASQQWNCHVYVGRDSSLPKSSALYDNQVNLNSTQGDKSLLAKLQLLGYRVPKINKRNEEGDYESRYSTGELCLQKMLVENQFNYNGGDPAIRAVLSVRELGKLASSYIYCDLYKSPDGDLIYLTNYNCGGTVTGRRSSRKHSFGFGNNAQNFPKHGRLARVFRRCIVARDNRLFLSVDQKGAEEWPVSALARNERALDEMRRGINRHIKRAAFIFAIPEQLRSETEWKDSLEYYLGKKTGHANNYGMQAARMSDSLCQEGHIVAVALCQNLLDKLNFMEPETRGVFHEYVKKEISKSRILRSPFGRERQFLGLRPNDTNTKIFNEAFSYIPQSTVGDNTGFGVHYLETNLPNEERCVVQEGHDSIVQETEATADKIWEHLQAAEKAFDRILTFQNGIQIQIPIEAEISYDFYTTVKIKDISYDGVTAALKKLNEKHQQELDEECQNIESLIKV